MGNHEINCEFCHVDQRNYGDTCCGAFVEQSRRARAVREAEREELRRAVRALDSNVRYYAGAHADTMYLVDVVKLLALAQDIARKTALEKGE